MPNKDKLEAGLDDLFSQPAEDTPAPEPVAAIEETVTVEQDAPPPLEAELEETEDVARDKVTVSEQEPIPIGAKLADASMDEDAAEEIEASLVEDVAQSKPDASVSPDEVGVSDLSESPPAEVPEEPVPTREVQLVVFFLSDEAYGVDIATVEQIIELPHITVVPHTPAYIAGLTNLRGTILPVIDLRKRLGLPTQESTRDTRVVVAQIQGVRVGMIVDAVIQVLRVPETSIESPSPLVTAVDSAYIVGIVKTESQLIVLLDLAHVLSRDGT